MADEHAEDVVIEHPNREKTSSKVVKAIVVLLMLASAGVMLIISFGGWDTLQGAKPVQIAYIAIYFIVAFYILRWRSGLLPVAAALAMVLGIFAAVAGPQWFARDKEGFTQPPIEADILGLLTFVLIPLQLALIAFAMRGFAQNWQVEVERHADGSTRSAPQEG